MSTYYSHSPAEIKSAGHTIAFDSDANSAPSWHAEPMAVLPIITRHFGLDPLDATRAAVEFAGINMATAWGAA